VTTTPETQGQTEQLQSAAPDKRSSRKSVLVLAVFALAINSTAAIYTLPSFDISLPNVGRLAELLPHHKASAPVPDPVVTALKDIQSAQQQHVAALQENSSSLQQNTTLLLQEQTALGSLRQSITDEHVDVKKISAQIADERVDVKKMSQQLSTLIAKVDALQNAVAPQITSSIPKARARNRLSESIRKRMARQSKPAGPVSVGGAPLSVPTTVPASQS
jgi:hypothetical protein